MPSSGNDDAQKKSGPRIQTRSLDTGSLALCVRREDHSNTAGLPPSREDGFMKALLALPILAAGVLFTGCEATVVDDGPHHGYYSGSHHYYDDRPGYYYGGPSYYSRASYHSPDHYSSSRSYYSSPRYGSYDRARSYYRSDAQYAHNTTVNRTVVNRTVNQTNVHRTNVVTAKSPTVTKKKQKKTVKIEG